jgi:hypothetical protein
MQIKKLIPLAFLGLGITEVAQAQTCSTTISTFPFQEDFEGASGAWATGGTNSSWVLGTPAKTVINSAGSGTKSWSTNNTGKHNTGEKSFVESPCFNFSALAQPMVELKIWWNSEFSQDGAVLQYTIDGGTTWQNVGAFNDGNNWYNDNTIYGAPGGQPVSTAQGWTGTIGAGGSGGWVTARHSLSSIPVKTSVKFRIAFGADTNGQEDGFAFDDFAILEAPANDAGVVAITAPGTPVLPGSPVPVMVTVKNYGTSPLTAANLGFSVNGAVQPTFPWTGNLAPNTVSAPVQIGTFAFPAGVQTIKAWSKNPNNVTDPSVHNDSVRISINSCNPLAGNFTINKNAVASATNFTSFSAAAQVLGNCGITAPVTLTVAPNSGPYNEQVLVPVIPGTSAANTVTFEGSGNTLSTNPSAATNPGLFILNGADYVRVNNLRLTVDAAATAGIGVQFLNAADNNIISNCTINLPVSSASDKLNGIVTGPNTTILGNHANNLLLQNNNINGGYYGILLNGISGTVTTTGNRVIGNQVRDSFFYGIFLNTGGTGTILDGNDISRPTRANATQLYGIYVSGTNNGAVISRNRIHNTHDAATSTTGAVYGIHISATATAGTENIIKNNLIYNLNNNGGLVNGIVNQGSNHAYIYNNSISVDNPAYSYTTLRGMHFASASTNVKFINNIVSLSSPATSKHAIYLASTTITLVSNNNDLYAPNGNVGFFTTDKATIADWKAVNSSAYDQNSVSIDPVFVSHTYLQPLAVALNNLGQPLAAVTDDVNGGPRSSTTPDMGAFEFTPAATDAGVIAINTPVSPVTPGSQPVSVTLKNFGTATLTSATIGWSVNGAAQPDYTWNGTLNSLQASASPVAIGNYNFPTGTFILKVWSKNPNGTTDALAVNDTTILRVVSCASLTGNFTVNKNIAASATNFQSLTDVAVRLSSCGVSGPVTITVTPNSGPYNEQVEIAAIPYTSVTNTVTFEGSGNTVSVIPGARPGIFVLNGADYVKLNNFVITLNPTATTGWGVQLVNAADNNIISNNTINLPLASTVNTVNGIIAGVATNTAGNNASNTRIQNNIINGGYYGVQLNGTAAGLFAANNQITGNQLKDQSNYGIYLNHTNGTLIESNDIIRPNRTTSAAITGIYTAGITQNTVISKNRFHNTHDLITASAGSVTGIYIASAAAPGNENIVKNNVFYNIKPVNGTFNALFNSGGSHTWYYYNTIVAEPGHAYLSLRGLGFNTTTTNVKFINNIVSMGGATANTKHAIYLPATGVTLQSNNNDLYVGTTGSVGYLGGDKITLADWQAANSNANDQNSVSADPVFVNAATGDLKPTLPTLDDKGQPVAAVTEDILGAARNTTTPDMGAYEFGVPANNVGIIAISGPSATGCGLTATESITVTIKNFGTSTQTSVPVTFSLNGTPMAATPETFTGSLAANATATYSFTAKANMSTSGPYRIIARTVLPGDLATANDADTLDATNSLMAGFPVPFDFETAATGLARFSKVTNPKSNIAENAAASFGTGSTKGIMMDGVDHAGWVAPAGVMDPWTVNPGNFAGAYICFNPAGGMATDSLWLTFDLKMLFKSGNINTNFRVTVNGTQVGSTYRPPFDPTNPATPIAWKKIKVNLFAYKNDPTVMIGLESSVKEEFANGTGTANLLDNVSILRRLVVSSPTGVKENTLASQLHVFPNPSNGNFFVSLENGMDYTLKVTDLTGKVILSQKARGDAKLNLESAAKGIYLLNVTSENGAAVRKLIVE